MATEADIRLSYSKFESVTDSLVSYQTLMYTK